jgi:dolichyl-phosphate-mannose-protein mannosyltransferase
VDGGEKLSYKTSFLRDFLHLNVAMMTSNNALIPDADKEPDIITSVPRQWPFASVGLRMNSWDDDNIKYYLLGNIAIWWGGAFSLIFYVITFLYYQVRRQRKIFDCSPGTRP